MLLVVLCIVFLSVCLAITVLFDADILTFLAVQFGKAPADEFNGKVVWITGASSGIGEALAKEIAGYGNVKIVISARRKEELERVKNECMKLSTSNDILVLPFDMTNIEFHQEAFDMVISRFGKLDILVSNAGQSQRAVWENIDLEVDKQVFDLNVFSVVNLNRIAVKYFLKVGGGHVAVTSSTVGRIAAPGSASYTASKHAIHGYFDSLRNEACHKNIHVTLLCPGPTFSDLLAQCFTDEPGRPLGGKMRPTDRRMTSERCAFLSAVAIANKLEESWIGLFPIVSMLYLSTYSPYVASKISKVIARNNVFMKIRDSGQKTLKTN